MKFIIFSFVLICSFAANCQTPEEQRFLDTLKMGGTYLIDKEMPEFKIKTVDGKEYSNKDLKNKITFINFWFEACAPCIAEMGALEALFLKFNPYKKFQFLSITYETKESIDNISLKYNMPYSIISTSPDSCYYLNFRKGFPTTIILNEEGRVAYFTIGGDTNPEGANLFFKTNIYPLLTCLLKCE